MTPASQTAINGLQTAFPSHPLDVEHAFKEWGVSYTDAVAFKNTAQGKRWDELPPRFLEYHHDALLFLGPEIVAEIIPAYLAAALRRDRELDLLPSFLIDVLTRGAERERFDARFGGLAAAQREAIACALEAWVGSLEESPRQRAITEALASYWRTTRSA